MKLRLNSRNHRSAERYQHTRFERAFPRFATLLQGTFDNAVFNIALALLILTSVALIFVEFLMPAGPELARVIQINNIITLLFAIELAFRFLIAPNKKIYFSNYWIDLLSVVPEFRIFRTFRIFRLLRLLRFTRAVIILIRQSGWISERAAKTVANFSLLIITTFLIIFSATLALLLFEVHHSETVPFSMFAERIWETAFLFTSGEIISGLPQTVGGKTVSLLVSVSGLVTFAVLVGFVTASVSTYLKTTMEAKELAIGDLEGHIVICGWERIAKTILNELEQNRDIWRNGVVLIAETDLNIPAEVHMKNPATFFHINGDFTTVENLEAAGIRRARTAIVLADKGKSKSLRDQDRDARTVLVCLTIEKLREGIFTVAELLNDENAEHLRMAGVEEILSRTGITGGLMASSAINQGMTSVIDQIISLSSETTIKKIRTPTEFVGKPIVDIMLFLKKEYNATLLALDRCQTDGSYEHMVNPAADTTIETADRLTLIVKRNSELNHLAL